MAPPAMGPTTTGPPSGPTAGMGEMQEAKKQKSFKCSDIPVFKIIVGSYCFVCLIIAIGILIWYLRVRAAARAIIGEVGSYDWEGLAQDIASYEEVALGYPYGTMQKLEGT